MNLFGSEKQNAAQTGIETPDTPISFGMKISWFAIKADSPEIVMDRLGCTKRKVSNWKNAFDNMFKTGQVFVTPSFDGWVLVLNYDNPANYNDMDCLKRIAARFEEMQYYVSSRISDLYCWVKFCDGRLVRGYYYLGERGEALWNEGELTAQEQELGLTMLPKSDIGEDWDDEAWDNITFPDEDSVLGIAAAWSTDPLLKKYKDTKSTGFLCSME